MANFLGLEERKSRHTIKSCRLKMAQSLEALYVKFGLAGSYHESGAKICFP